MTKPWVGYVERTCCAVHDLPLPGFYVISCWILYFALWILYASDVIYQRSFHASRLAQLPRFCSVLRRTVSVRFVLPYTISFPLTTTMLCMLIGKYLSPTTVIRQGSSGHDLHTTNTQAKPPHRNHPPPGTGPS